MKYCYTVLYYVSGLQALCMKVKVAQSCPLCDLVDYTVHGILQARILEWIAFPFSRGSSQPRDRTRSPALQADSLSTEPPCIFITHRCVLCPKCLAQSMSLIRIYRINESFLQANEENFIYYFIILKISCLKLNHKM